MPGTSARTIILATRAPFLRSEYLGLGGSATQSIVTTKSYEFLSFRSRIHLTMAGAWSRMIEREQRTWKRMSSVVISGPIVRKEGRKESGYSGEVPKQEQPYPPHAAKGSRNCAAEHYAAYRCVRLALAINSRVRPHSTTKNMIKAQCTLRPSLQSTRTCPG